MPRLSSSAKRRVGERRGDATTALSRGEKVQLRFCLPPEIGLPETILPGVYYDFCKEEVYRLRRSAHQLHPEQPDLKLIAVNRTAPDRYEVASCTAPPGILRRPPRHGFRLSCDMGPFTLADERNGVLEIPVPGPAGLNIHFDPGAVDAEKLPFQGVFCEVMWKIPGHGDSMQPILEQRLPTVKVDLRVTDLGPAIISSASARVPNRVCRSRECRRPGSESGSGKNRGVRSERSYRSNEVRWNTSTFISLPSNPTRIAAGAPPFACRAAQRHARGRHQNHCQLS